MAFVSAKKSTDEVGVSTPIDTPVALKPKATKALAVAGVGETPKTQRGHNKPKCINCGNVARSRCPFHSCKSCCSKAQNPCVIHVLKPNGNIPEKVPSSTSPSFDQQKSEVSPAATSHRVTSFRQLSNSFSQFNNLQIPIRSRKPLTRKEAVAINEWRFLKLKENKERLVDGQDEALDRYLLSISLLEEVLCMKCEGHAEDGSMNSKSNATSSADNNSGMVQGMKFEISSNFNRSALFRNRIKEFVLQGLVKLKQFQLNNDLNVRDDQNVPGRRPKRAKITSSLKISLFDDFIEKLNKARNNEDLESCLNMKSEIFEKHRVMGQAEGEDSEKPEKSEKDDSVPVHQLCYFPKVYRTFDIDHRTLSGVDLCFQSLKQVEGL